MKWENFKNTFNRDTKEVKVLDKDGDEWTYTITQPKAIAFFDIAFTLKKAWAENDGANVSNILLPMVSHEGVQLVNEDIANNHIPDWVAMGALTKEIFDFVAGDSLKKKMSLGIQNWTEQATGWAMKIVTPLSELSSVINKQHTESLKKSTPTRKR